ncbi:MAG: ferritin [Bacteroidota bacterium]
MKDIIRRQAILKESIIESINKQIKIEGASSSAYLAMAGWCDAHGYENCAKFFFSQSDEERGHKLKFFHYLLDMEAEAISPSIDEVEHEYTSLKAVFEKALENEIAVTESIHDLVRLARKEGDIASEEFLRWFVQEQIEEEFVARKCLGFFELYGEDKLAISMIESQILSISYKQEGA